MKQARQNIWSSRPYYYIYMDNDFLKNVYAQLFSDFPDIGIVAYIGANTHKYSKDYFFDGEQSSGKERRKNLDKENLDCRKNMDNREKAGIRFCNADESSEIREHANIGEIKDMSNIAFLNELIKRLTDLCNTRKYKQLEFIKGNICMYNSYKEGEDVFASVNNCCIWLKQKNMETCIENVCNIMGEANILGYVIREATDNSPKIIKVVAIFI